MVEICTPEELIERWVEPDSHVHIASTMSRPNGLLRVMARSLASRGKVRVTSNAIHSMGHCLTMADVVSRARTAFIGDTIPSPRPNPLYRKVVEGEPYAVEETSLLSLNLQLMAGAMGLSSIQVPGLGGSDLERDLDSTGSLPSLRPDVTLVHAHCADRDGNLYFSGPAGEGVWGCLAARQGVLATVETLVEDPPNDGWSVPADRVLGVAECPLGAHPQGMSSFPAVGFDGYLDDKDFLQDLGEACADPDLTKAWYRFWVDDLPDHTAYLEALGAERTDVLRLSADPVAKTRSQPPSKSYDLRELAVLVAAREIVDLVATHGYHSILTGIGTAHHASWVAAELLRRRGIRVALLAELGMVDYHPAPADSFLFSQRHVARTRHLTGTLEVLGGLVAGGGKGVLGVLAAAQIDPSGRINSSRTSSGNYLVGSGGANDIASTVDTVVVARTGTQRFVERAAFVTCPGHRVRSVISELGRFHRSDDGDFRLATWAGATVPTATVAAAEALRRTTAWSPRPWADLKHETQPTPDELQLLRTFT